MATYSPTKTLVSAKPKIRTSDSVVLEWEIEVEYSLAEDTENSLPAWTTTYGADINVESLGKQTSGFTQSELVGLMPSRYDEVFDDHYEHFNNINQPAPVETVDDSFDITTLSES